MTLAELLQNRFRADLRHRGAAYIEAERVSLVRVTPENVFGVVVDGVEYQTQLRYQESDIALFCTCDQFARSKSCKHLWATVLTADVQGCVNPAIRPGRLTPFVSREKTAPIRVDDLTIPGETDDSIGSPRSAKRKTATTDVPVRDVRLAPWESKLEDLREEMAVPTRPGKKSQVQERQIFYEIDLAASREAGKLVIQATQRQRRSSGQWGKVKPLKVRS
ncbi:MAG: helicase SNF2, partial [Planctomycetaceae bacterium]|nr:helicase SNF2 [Planctomycetaceae bacterium]